MVARKCDDCQCGSQTVVWLTERQVAARLAMSVKWLQKERSKGSGIPYKKFGSSVRYKLQAVLDYEESGIQRSTSDNR